MIKECKYCNVSIEYDSKYQLGAHVGNCKLNPNRTYKSSKHPLIVYKCLCEKCNDEYEIELSENNYNKGKYKKYCSRKCANSRIITQEHKNKTSSTIKSKGYKRNGLNYCPVYFIKCKYCDELFTSRKKNQIFCSKSCSSSYNNVFLFAGHKGGLSSVKSQSDNRRGKNEKAFAELCLSKFNNVECNKSIFNGWDADIIIHDLKIAILWNGKWHYEKITKKHSVLQVQNRDSIKIKEIIRCGYEPYTIKDMGKFDINKVNIEWSMFLDKIKKD